MNEDEKRSLLEMARSTSVREEFRAIRAASEVPGNIGVDVDALLAFLSAVNRAFTLPPGPFVPHTRVLL